MSQRNKTYQYLLIFGFFCILFTPWFIELTESGDTSLDNRELAGEPELFATDFNAKWEAYYNDHYGLRNQLIAIGGYVRTAFFKSSPKPEIVVFGKDNWLFYNSKGDYIYHSYSKLNRLNHTELKAFHKNFIWKKERCLANSVAHFYQILWPNKHTVYSEYLSGSMQMQIVSGLSKREQIDSLFLKDTSLGFIDLTDELIDRKEEQIYFKYDTHWNQLGAYYAYKRVLDTLFPFLKTSPFNLEAFDLTTTESNTGDLVKLMGIKQLNSTEKIPNLNLKVKLDTTILSYSKNDVSIIEFHNNKIRNGEVLLLFGDSYLDKIQWLFSLHFEKVICIRSGFSEEWIRIFKPTIVFETKVERYL